MLILDHAEERVIEATPEQVFAVVGDPTRHAELCGSGEVRSVWMVSDGPVGVGSTFEADEDIAVGPGRSRFTALSSVVEFAPPTVISWTSMPPNRPKPKRIQWWFRLTPVDGGTRVVHAVQVDLGPVANVVMKPFYGAMRGKRVVAGMRGTLDNLAKAVSDRPEAVSS